MVHRHIHVRTYIDNKPYSKMVHRNIYVRTYIDNIPYSTMVHRNIHVRTYIDNKPYHAVQWFTETYMYVYLYIYIYVWKLNQTVLELDFRAVKFFFFPRRDLNPHQWYTAAPFA
jgi:hypothetical protein